MNDRDFRQTLAKLRTMIAINDAKIMSNPKPYLDDMARRCSELLAVLDKVEYALSPDVVFDYWDANADKKAIPRPTDIQGEAYIRCKAAMDAIHEYRYK